MLQYFIKGIQHYIGTVRLWNRFESLRTLIRRALNYIAESQESLIWASPFAIAIRISANASARSILRKWLNTSSTWCLDAFCCSKEGARTTFRTFLLWRFRKILIQPVWCVVLRRSTSVCTVCLLSVLFYIPRMSVTVFNFGRADRTSSTASENIRAGVTTPTPKLRWNVHKTSSILASINGENIVGRWHGRSKSSAFSGITSPGADCAFLLPLLRPLPSPPRSIAQSLPKSVRMSLNIRTLLRCQSSLLRFSYQVHDWRMIISTKRKFSLCMIDWNLFRRGTISTDRSRHEECARSWEEGMEINNLPAVLWSRGPFPRVTMSEDYGIRKESQFSCKPVFKRECSHYFHVRCQKRQVYYRDNKEHLLRHERLPSCPVWKQVTKMILIWTTGWKRENKTIDRTEEGSVIEDGLKRKETGTKSVMRGETVWLSFIKDLTREEVKKEH